MIKSVLLKIIRFFCRLLSKIIYFFIPIISRIFITLRLNSRIINQFNKSQYPLKIPIFDKLKDTSKKNTRR